MISRCCKEVHSWLAPKFPEIVAYEGALSPLRRQNLIPATQFVSDDVHSSLYDASDYLHLLLVRPEKKVLCRLVESEGVSAPLFVDIRQCRGVVHVNCYYLAGN